MFRLIGTILAAITGSIEMFCTLTNRFLSAGDHIAQAAEEEAEAFKLGLRQDRLADTAKREAELAALKAA